MERSILGVPERVKLLFRVFLLRNGVWEMVNLPPFDVQHRAVDAVQMLSNEFPDDVYGVRHVQVLLN